MDPIKSSQAIDNSLDILTARKENPLEPMSKKVENLILDINDQVDPEKMTIDEIIGIHIDKLKQLK